MYKGPSKKCRMPLKVVEKVKKVIIFNVSWCMGYEAHCGVGDYIPNQCVEK